MNITPIEARQVALAIVAIVENGYIPPAVPIRYQQALRDFCDGRVDRTSERKSRLDRAVKSLTPVLNAIDRKILLSTRADSLFFSQISAYSKLQPSLPVPKLHEKYEHKYVAKGGETITDVAKKFGHPSACCLCHAAYAYPPNMRLQIADTIYVPYNTKILKQMSNGYDEMVNRAEKYVKIAEKQLHMDEKKLTHWLIILDIMALLGGIVAINEMGQIVIKATNEMGQIVIKKGEIVKTVMELTAIVNDETANYKPHILSVGLRHLTGVLSPSWWASFLQALGTGEWRAWLYGPEGVAQKRLDELKGRTEHYCNMLKIDAESLKAQEKSPIYTHKCARCS